MAETIARIKREGKHFEVLVDMDEALMIRDGKEGADIARAVMTSDIFYNLKSGEKASNEDLENNFGSTDPTVVAEKIIKTGEVVRTAESMKEGQDKKYKQVVDFLVRNAQDANGRPFTPDRIMKALHESHVNVKNKPIEEQVNDIVDALSKILPIKIEKKKVKLRIPAAQAGKTYGAAKEFAISEKWENNGDVEVIVEVPSGLLFDFYDKINNLSHGSVLSEEIKE